VKKIFRKAQKQFTFVGAKVSEHLAESNKTRLFASLMCQPGGSPWKEPFVPVEDLYEPGNHSRGQ
jgi:hypothetical protein